MHTSSLDHMQLCIHEHLRRDRHYRILDLGSRQVVKDHATHRGLLDGYDCDYVGVDVAAGANVDIVMPKPYRIPLKRSTVDVVMTAQAFEHIPFPWASFMEITFVPVLGALTCGFLVGPWTGRDPQQYVIGGILVAVGVALWVVTMYVNRATGQKVEEPLADDLSERGLNN